MSVRKKIPLITADATLNIDAGHTLDISGGNVSIVGTGVAVVTFPASTSTLATLALSETLTNKTIDLTDNTLSGTKAEFNTACSDGTFVYTGDAVLGATAALDNLASVAINTTLVSDTDNTDALGTTAIAWSDLFLGNESVITWTSAPSTSDLTLTHSAETLTFAGGTIALGTATATSLDMGASTLATRSLTVDTGGVFNVAIGSDAGDDFTIDTNKFVVSGDTGYIGIGTATPTSLLSLGDASSIISTDTANSSDNKRLALTGGGTAGRTRGATIYLEGNEYGGANKGNIDFIAGASSGEIKFTAGVGDQYMVMDKDGNVGVGETAPDGKLHVKSASFPVGKFERETTLTGGAFDSTSGIASGFLSATQTSDNMADGFGGGILFSIGDDGLSADANFVARLYARRDGADNEGAFQIWGGTGGRDLLQTWRANGNTGIGTASPNANAILDVTSTTKAFMPPRMTTAQRDAISSPTEGMVVHNLTTHVLNFHNGTAWGAV